MCIVDLNLPLCTHTGSRVCACLCACVCLSARARRTPGVWIKCLGCLYPYTFQSQGHCSWKTNTSTDTHNHFLVIGFWRWSHDRDNHHYRALLQMQRTSKLSDYPDRLSLGRGKAEMCAHTWMHCCKHNYNAQPQCCVIFITANTDEWNKLPHLTSWTPCMVVSVDASFNTAVFYLALSISWHTRDTNTSRVWLLQEAIFFVYMQRHACLFSY